MIRPAGLLEHHLQLLYRHVCGHGEMGSQLFLVHDRNGFTPAFALPMETGCFKKADGPAPQNCIYIQYLKKIRTSPAKLNTGCFEWK